MQKAGKGINPGGIILAEKKLDVTDLVELQLVENAISARLSEIERTKRNPELERMEKIHSELNEEYEGADARLKDAEHNRKRLEDKLELQTEKIKKNDLAVIVFALAGIVFFFFDKLTIGNLFGNVLAAISGLSFAFFIITIRKQREQFPLISIFIGNIATVLITLPFIFSSIPTDTFSWVSLCFLGFIQLGFSYILYSMAIKKVSALQASMIPIIEPILTTFWVLIFIRERPQNWAIAGGIIVIVSLILHFKISLKNCQ